MRIQRRDGSDERRILTGLVVDRTLLAKVASKYQVNMFRSKWGNLIAKWCVDYFNRYDQAPNQSIEAVFEKWADGRDDEETIKMVDRFLASLSDEYQSASEINSDYLADLAASYFERVQLERLTQNIEADLDSGQVVEARKRVATYADVDLSTSADIDVLQDQEAIRKAFESKQDPVIRLHGALGHLFGTSLERDGFVVFQGPEKRGKTFWLLELAWQAMLERKRVAFFEVGDLSQDQIMRRFMVRAASKPLLKQTIDYPARIERSKEDKTARVTFKQKVFGSDLNWQEAFKACQKIIKTKVKTRKPLLKLKCYPNSSLTMEDVFMQVADWERAGWVPDMLVIDYADILLPSARGDEQEQVNDVWKKMRRLSQESHCLVVTATQADAASYDAYTMTKKNFSRDKRKYGHVTAMYGINQTHEEKELGVTRINCIVRREEDYKAFNELQCVHVANCLPLANMAVRSCW